MIRLPRQNSTTPSPGHRKRIKRPGASHTPSARAGTARPFVKAIPVVLAVCSAAEVPEQKNNSTMPSRIRGRAYTSQRTTLFDQMMQRTMLRQLARRRNWRGNIRRLARELRRRVERNRRGMIITIPTPGAIRSIYQPTAPISASTPTLMVGCIIQLWQAVWL